jgi:hypothetical protein
LAVVHGGLDTEENVVPACGPCNAAKNVKTGLSAAEIADLAAMHLRIAKACKDDAPRLLRRRERDKAKKAPQTPAAKAEAPKPALDALLSNLAKLADDAPERKP